MRADANKIEHEMKRLLMICVMATMGCANKLETGYVPRKLNANSA
jgi:hypothetical protein